MSTPNQFASYVQELLQPLGRISCHRFFGGTAYRMGGKQFAMLIKQKLYFRVDEVSRPHYEQAGSQPFTYASSRGQICVQQYYNVPESLLDEPEALLEWARSALMAAEGAAQMTASKGSKKVKSTQAH